MDMKVVLCLAALSANVAALPQFIPVPVVQPAPTGTSTTDNMLGTFRPPAEFTNAQAPSVVESAVTGAVSSAPVRLPGQLLPGWPVPVPFSRPVILPSSSTTLSSSTTTSSSHTTSTVHAATTLPSTDNVTKAALMPVAQLLASLVNSFIALLTNTPTLLHTTSLHTTSLYTVSKTTTSLHPPTSLKSHGNSKRVTANAASIEHRAAGPQLESLIPGLFHSVTGNLVPTKTVANEQINTALVNNLNSLLAALPAPTPGGATTLLPVPKELTTSVTTALIQNPVAALQLAYGAIINSLWSGIPNKPMSLPGLTNSLTSVLGPLFGGGQAPVLVGNGEAAADVDESPESSLGAENEEDVPSEQDVFETMKLVKRLAPDVLGVIPSAALLAPGATNSAALPGDFQPLGELTPLAAVPYSLAALVPGGAVASAFVPVELASALADPTINPLASGSINPLAPIPTELIPESAADALAAAATALASPFARKPRSHPDHRLMGELNSLQRKDLEALKAGLEDSPDPQAFIAKWVALQAKPLLDELAKQIQAAPTAAAKLVAAQASIAAAPASLAAAQLTAVKPLVEALPSIVSNQLGTVPTAAAPLLSAASSIIAVLETASVVNPVAEIAPSIAAQIVPSLAAPVLSAASSFVAELGTASLVNPIAEIAPSIAAQIVPSLAAPVFSAASSFAAELETASLAVPLGPLLPNATALAQIIAEGLPQVSISVDASFTPASSTKTATVVAPTVGAVVSDLAAVLFAPSLIAVTPQTALATPLPTILPVVGLPSNSQQLSSLIQQNAPLESPQSTTTTTPLSQQDLSFQQRNQNGEQQKQQDQGTNGVTGIIWINSRAWPAEKLLLADPSAHVLVGDRTFLLSSLPSSVILHDLGSPLPHSTTLSKVFTRAIDSNSHLRHSNNNKNNKAPARPQLNALDETHQTLDDHDDDNDDKVSSPADLLTSLLLPDSSSSPSSSSLIDADPLNQLLTSKLPKLVEWSVKTQAEALRAWQELLALLLS